MNMYVHELKALLKSAVIWTLSMIAMAALYFSLYQGISADANGFRDLLSGYPAQVQALLGVSLDTITTILGFYSMIFTFVLLFGAIQSMNLGLSVLSKEARERTADFLLVKPVSRPSIVTAKVLAGITILLGTNVVYQGASYLMAMAVRNTDFSGKVFFLVNLSMLFIQLMFMALGLFISVFFQRLRAVLPISLGVVFGLYIIGALLVTDEKDAARYLSPFRYFDIAYIVKNGRYEVSFAVIGAAVVCAAIAAAYVIYWKKDIHAVS